MVNTECVLIIKDWMKLLLKDSYALSFIDELVFSIKGAKIFSALDLYSGYHQIPMNPTDIEKTSFTTKFGSYNFKVMPFGLTYSKRTKNHSFKSWKDRLMGQHQPKVSWVFSYRWKKTNWNIQFVAWVEPCHLLKKKSFCYRSRRPRHNL